MATYGSTAGANSLVQSWDGATNPTAAQVTAWLAEAYVKINRAIARGGYTTPIATTVTALYPELTGLENLYAAAYVLRSQGIDTNSGDTQARSEIWLADFYSQLNDLALSNLSLLGASLLLSTTLGRRRRIGTLQMRKVDGYSGRRTIIADDQSFAQAVLDASQGEYTASNNPTE